MSEAERRASYGRGSIVELVRKRISHSQAVFAALVPGQIANGRYINRWRCSMSCMKQLSFALAIGCSIVGYVPFALAQDDSQREAAISKCVREAQAMTGASPEQQASRVAAYKACMTAAGFKP